MESLPPGVLSQIRDVFSVMAQQFRGYIFRQEYTVCDWLPCLHTLL